MGKVKRTVYKKRVRRQKKVNPGAKVGAAAYTLAEEAMKGIRYIKKSLLNPESKYYNLQLLTTPFDNTGITGNLHAIAQGNAYNQRSGDSIKVNNVHMKYVVSLATAVSQFVRVVIVRGKNENTIVPTAALMFDVTGSLGVITSGRSPNDTSIYQVLYDKTHVLNTNGTALISEDVFIDLDTHIKYSQGATTPETGGLYYFFFSGTAVAGDRPLVTFYNRTRFIDN